MSNWSPTYKAVCDICGETQEVRNYGDWACRKCLQGYTYEECHQITLTDAQLALLRNPPRWIPVEERLPSEHACVLAYHSNARRIIAWHDGNGWQTDADTGGRGDVTHWMPLPEPPEVK